MSLRRAALLAPLGLLACLPQVFDELAEAAPVDSVAVAFPGQPEAEIRWARTVPADDEGRGRVLFSDGEAALGWLRIDEAGGTQLYFATPEDLAVLAGQPQPALTGLAVVEDAAIAEGLVRFAASAVEGELPAQPDRIVRFYVGDYSRPSPPELDMRVYPWVAEPPPALVGPLAAVQLDGGRAEALSASADGAVLIWDELGANLADYTQAREAALAEDPGAFDGDQASQGYGLTRCPSPDGEPPQAIAGGALLGAEPAAVILRGPTLSFVGVDPDDPQTSSIGAPIYACELATLELPGPAETLLVDDIDGDGDDDLLVGAPALAQVFLYRNFDPALGVAASPEPDAILEAPKGEAADDFGRSLARVELGGEAPALLVVGAPATGVEGEAEVGAVHLFEIDGTWVTKVADLWPRATSRHGLGVHGVDLPGREELLVTGRLEVRVHARLMAGDPGF